MILRALRAAGCAVGFAGIALAPGATRAADATDGLALVHVEANVGSASGGHLALLVGDRLHHFQVDSSGPEAGRLLQVREDWEPARFRYGTLENRPLHVAWVPLSAAQLDRVRDRLRRSFLEQQREREALRRAGDDVAHLEALRGAGPGVPVAAAGLLDPARPGTARPTGLRDRIARELGAGFLERERRRTAEGRAALGLPGPGTSPDLLLQRREHLAVEWALRALAEAWPLAPRVSIEAPGAAALNADERRVLRAFAADLDRSVLALLRSARPDRGQALLLATARRLALARSLASGRLVLLDPLPARPPTLSARELATLRPELEATLAIARRAWREERQARLAAPLDEPRLNRLEQSAARTRELQRAAADSSIGVRVPSGLGALVPARSRAIPVAAQPGAALDRALAASIARREALEARFDGRYAYHLLRRNCVHALDALLTDSLGREGWPVAGDDFVPWLYFARARAGLPGARVERLSSYRERALADLYAREAPAWVYARESNRLFSAVYRYRPRDGSFLFFTSDAVAPRPIFGAANLAWALGDGLLGLASAPFDRGHRLRSAGRGLFFSAPELVFLNFRKGSFDAASLEADASGGGTRQP